MSTNQPANNDPLESNIRALLRSTEPELTMPEADKRRIVSLLTVRQAKTPSGAQRFAAQARAILRSRLARYASIAAAAGIVLAVVSLWTGDSHNGLAWADVVKQMSEVKTLVYRCREETTDTLGKSVVRTYRCYLKDPGRFRQETLAPTSTQHPSSSAPESIQEVLIIIRGQGRQTTIRLDPSQKSGRVATQIGPGEWKARTDAADTWKELTRITSDQTREIGRRDINGVRTVGFEAPIQDGAPQTRKITGTVRVWVAVGTALPVLVESQFRWNGHTAKWTMEGIQANVPLSDDLFDVSHLKGWNILRESFRPVTFSKTALKHNVTLRVGLKGKAPVITERDVEEVDSGTVTTYGTAGDGSSHVMIHAKLSEAGGRKMEELTLNHIGQRVLIDFNGEVQSEPSIRSVIGRHLSLSITELGKTPEQFENDYLTDSRQPSPTDGPATRPQ